MSLTAAIMALAAAAVPLPTADRQSVDRTIAAIYGVYRRKDDGPAVWERPIFSRNVEALIAHWKRVMPQDEVDDLNDGDWLCLCQDWDQRNFRVTTLARSRPGPNLAEVRLRIAIGYGQSRDMRLLLRREPRGWRIDNLIARDFPRGLQQALRETIAEDEKLRK